MEYSQAFTSAPCFSGSKGYHMKALHTPPMGQVGDQCMGHCVMEHTPKTPQKNLDHNYVFVLSINTTKNGLDEPPRCPEKDLPKEQALKTTWCETPRVHKKDGSLRRRLLDPQAATDGKPGSPKSSGHRALARSSIRKGPLRGSLDFNSPDAAGVENFATSTLKVENDAVCGRGWRSMFSLVRTSTLEDCALPLANPSFESKPSNCDPNADFDESIISGLLEANIPQTPKSGDFILPGSDNLKTPVNQVGTNLSDSLSLLNTPLLTPVSRLKDTPSADTPSTDSGFSSLGLDKSQNSSLDCDGSFQELIRSATPGGKEAKRLAEVKRRSRLERQRRLSTLREGGSQSEDDTRLATTSHTPCTKPQKQSLDGSQLRCLPIEEDDDPFLDGTPLSATQAKLQDLSLTPALHAVYAMSRRSARMLPEQTSLEELLKATAEEEDDATATRPTKDLSALIGRKMGFGQMDIVAELRKRNLRHVLAMILGQLSGQDIYNFGKVSDVWDEIVHQNKKACHKRKVYLAEVKKALEMASPLHVPDAETRLNLSFRSALHSVQAQSHTPSATPSRRLSGTPIQHTSNRPSKMEDYLQVAKTLLNDEWLKPCPRCQRPAKCHSVKREGVCSRKDCGFSFCTACLCAYHGSRDCAHLSAKRRSKKDVLAGSAQSKRNIRRL